MPIFDIFSSRKNKSKKKQKPKIIMDIHEKNSLVLSNLTQECEVEFKPLEIGDYLIGETIIERKTFSDFIGSMLSRRLIEQLTQMQKYNSKILILEGRDFEKLEARESKMNPNSIRGMILSASIDFNTNVIFTKDSEETAKYLILLAKRQLKGKANFTLHSRKPMSRDEQKQYIIESFPNIGPKKAEALLNKFKTLNQIFNASEEELQGILRNQAKEFKGILD
jgi:ERCC4-type nuclease